MNIGYSTEAKTESAESSLMDTRITEIKSHLGTVSKSWCFEDVCYQSQDQNLDEIEKAKPLLIMKVNVGNGQKYDLPVMEDDDPYELAQAFCRKYNLHEKAADKLAHNIYENLEQILREVVLNVDQSHWRTSLSRTEGSYLFKQPKDLLDLSHNEKLSKRRKDSKEAIGHNIENNIKKRQKSAETKDLEQITQHKKSNSSTDISPI